MPRSISVAGMRQRGGICLAAVGPCATERIMRKVFVIGIGAGNPDYITVQAINALNEVDVFFVMDKGSDKDDLVRVRRDICERYIKNKSYRTIEVADPPRDRNPASYETAVEKWHE